MLWENDGSAGDAINAIADEIGDGVVMDAMRKHLRAGGDAHETRLLTDLDAIAERLHGVERVAENETGLIPDVSIPVILYHQYPAEFRMQAARSGIALDSQGYECWSCPEFVTWFKKKHPELVHKEAKRAASIIVPGSKYGGLLAA
jgi:hypothetical protein